MSMKPKSDTPLTDAWRKKMGLRDCVGMLAFPQAMECECERLREELRQTALALDGKPCEPVGIAGVAQVLREELEEARDYATECAEQSTKRGNEVIRLGPEYSRLMDSIIALQFALRAERDECDRLRAVCKLTPVMDRQNGRLAQKRKGKT